MSSVLSEITDWLQTAAETLINLFANKLWICTTEIAVTNKLDAVLSRFACILRFFFFFFICHGFTRAQILCLLLEAPSKCAGTISETLSLQAIPASCRAFEDCAILCEKVCTSFKSDLLIKENEIFYRANGCGFSNFVISKHFVSQLLNLF